MRWENQAVSFVDHWRPFGLVAAVSVLGVFLGVVIGLSACGPTSVLDEVKEARYFVLASKLYSQGESLDSMKVYLSALRSQDVSSGITRLAEKYEQSSDDGRRAEAKDLRQLGDALRAGPGLPSSLGQVPLPSVIPLASQTPTSTVVVTSLPMQSAPTPTRIPEPPTPTTTSTPAPVNTRGVASPAGGGGAILREQATTKSAWVASIPTGGKVDILKIVQGEAIDPAEPRWYQVKYGDKTGYVYFKLIVQGE